MRYDRGDSFPFDFEPNRIPFDSKSKGKLSPRSYPIQYERKWMYSFLSLGEKGEAGACFTGAKCMPKYKNCTELMHSIKFFF